MAHQGCKVFPLVKEVRAYVKEGDGDQGADCHDVADEHWINGTDPSTNNTPIANPMSGYAQYAGARKSWGINALGGLVVEVEAGQEELFGEEVFAPVCFLIREPDREAALAHAARLARETSAILFENSSCRDAHALCRVSCDPTHASRTSLTSAVSEAHCCIAVATASSALSARVVAADSICDCAAWASLSS